MTRTPAMLAAPGRTLAWQHSPGRPPTVVFCTGFRSDMTGAKALALEAHCRAQGQGFARFDYRGHGASPGRFEDGTIGLWRDDALAVIDALPGPLVLVGSSMGGWIMLLAALARPGRVAGLVGIAAAPDFTEELIWREASPEARRALVLEGIWHEPSAYDPVPTPITRALIEDGRRHLLLGGPIPISVPVHLLHGQRDPDVPWTTALRLAERLESERVVVELIKDGEHRLSRPGDLARIARALDEVTAQARAAPG